MAESLEGCTEAIMLAHGITPKIIDNLIDAAGLTTAEGRQSACWPAGGRRGPNPDNRCRPAGT
jgi:hypothetical protein